LSVITPQFPNAERKNLEANPSPYPVLELFHPNYHTLGSDPEPSNKKALELDLPHLWSNKIEVMLTSIIHGAAELGVLLLRDCKVS
jgi:hypothetical protein